MSWDALAQFGLAGLIFGGFICVLKWVFDINNKLLLDMADERSKALEIHTGFVEKLKEISLLNQSFHTEVKTEHLEQRNEHKELLKAINQ